MSEYWLLAQTKPRQEEVAYANLQNQGYMVNLPRIAPLRPRKPSGRSPSGTSEPTEPLFPGYIFFAPAGPQQSIAPVRSTRGILRVVRFSLEPAQISQAMLQEILDFVQQTQQAPGGLLAHLNKIVLDARVTITQGPFSGLSGLVSAVAGDRVQVLLEIMGKVQALGFEASQLEGA
jgi:transcriptional antiterminator RfaH